MQAVSTAWRENQAKPMTTEGFVELSYYLTDPNLQVGAIEPSNELSFSTSQAVISPHSRHITRFGTLEQNIWLLDGNTRTLPEVIANDRPFVGFISNTVGNANGVFSIPVRLDVLLSEPAVILPGVTIEWGQAFGGHAVDFCVVHLDANGDEQKRLCIMGNQDTRSLIHFEMRDVHGIRIEVERWNTPNRRVRIENLFLGHSRVYTKDHLFSFSNSHTVDPVSARLPKYEIAFEIDNRSRDFDPIDDDSLSKYVLERQEITTRYGFRDERDGIVEWISGGQYFLSDWVSPQNGLSASFRARDLLGFLDNVYHQGKYHVGSGVSLYNLAEDVLNDAIPLHLGRREGQWKIDERLRAIRTVSPLPLVTHAECLQLIANAAGATMYFDRAGVLHIEQLGSFAGTASRALDSDNTYSRPEIDFLRPLKSVQVSAYHWQVEDDETILYDEMLPLEAGENTFIIEYSDAATDVRIVHGFGSGVTFDAFARSASLRIQHTGAPVSRHVQIYGKIIRPAETVVSVDSDDRGETLPLKNVLITDVSRARNIAQWLMDRYRNRKNVSVDWRVDPSMDVMDVVALGSEARAKTARILSTDFRFSGAFMGKSEGVVIQ